MVIAKIEYYETAESMISDCYFISVNKGFVENVRIKLLKI